MDNDNNGYIKINSREDLPKQEAGCWFIVDGVKMLGVYSPLSNSFYHKSARYYYSNVEHYITVPKPEKDPLY